ncbi:retrotransposon-related protein [Tanacetum coccineum]
MVVPSPSSPKWWVVSIRLLLDTISNLDSVLTHNTGIKSQSILGLFDPQSIAVTRSMAAKRTGGNGGVVLDGEDSSVNNQSSNNQTRRSRLNNIEDESDDDDKLEDSGCRWLFKVGQFFSLDKVKENTKLPLAVLHLEGKSLQWHQGYMTNRNQVTPSWKQYVKDIMSRFGAPYDDPIAELMELKQTGSVTKVHDLFDCILSRLQLPPKYAMSCFLSILNEEISNMVRMFKPSTIQEAFSLAKLHEYYKTIRIVGHMGTRKVHMLMDMGSSHNFIDYALAVNLGCKMVKRNPMVVRVANGNKIQCDTMVQDFRWKMHSIEFSIDLMVMHLGGSDMVLGEEYSNDLQVKVVADAPVSKDIQQLIQKNEQNFQDPVNLPPFRPGKCAFGVTQIEYLGHVISDSGVATDPMKIKAIVEWPSPVTLKQLRGFLGLTGYYRRFIKDYGGIAKPLTQLLKKDSFEWNSEAEKAFQHLKQAMITPPILALPDFSSTFIIETDALSQGIGVVLMQHGHPIAFISKALSLKNLMLSTYERELLAVIHVVQKWNHYLLDKHFIIKTDQESLKYLLEHKLATPFQQKWVSELLGFDYEIQYKKGVEKQTTWNSDPVLHKLISELQLNPSSHSRYQWTGKELKRNSKLVIGNDTTLKQKLLHWMHNSPQGGHSGIPATLKRIQSLFYRPKLRTDVHTYIKECEVCQKCKANLAASPGLLQPLPIPKGIWEDIAMDFIEGLPISKGKSVILVVIGRLSKYSHFIALKHPFSALTVAQKFLDTIVKLHGFPTSIVSDRDKIFLSQFWTELLALNGIDQNLSTAYHPQSDGQSEVLNRCLEGYLRCMCFTKPNDWVNWLPLAEYWYNTSFHTATKHTPFEIVYGQKPPLHLPYLPGESKVEALDRRLQAREETIQQLKENLSRSKNRMKQFADRHRSERSYQVGKWVYLKLQPYRQSSMEFKSNQKIAAKYYGPFPIIAKIGQVAYTLQIPPNSAIHLTFHVSLLKPYHGTLPASLTLPSTHQRDHTSKVPAKVLEIRTVKKNNAAHVE